MAENYFTIKLLQLCKTELKDSPNLDNFVNRLNDLKLTPSEEKFLTVVFPPDFDNFDFSLKHYETTIVILRGQDGVNDYWLSLNQLSKTAFNRKLLEDPWFFNKVMRSIYVYREQDFPALAVGLTNIYLAYVGDNWVPEVSVPYDFYYLRAFLLLMEKYFGIIEEKWQFFFLKSKWMPYYVSIGLDLDKIINDAVLYFSSIVDRQEFSLNLAVSLLSNTTAIGSDEKGVKVTFSYWLEKFQNYYQQQTPGLRMTNFLADENLWKTTSVDEKEVIKQLLFVYNNLTTDFYVYKDINEKDVERITKVNKVEVEEIKVDYSEIKIGIENKFTKDTEGQFVDLAGVLEEIESLSDRYKDAKIKDLYFFEENEGKFKWSI